MTIQHRGNTHFSKTNSTISPGSVQCQGGQGSEKPGLLECVPAMAEDWKWTVFKVPSNLNNFVTLT